MHSIQDLERFYLLLENCRRYVHLSKLLSPAFRVKCMPSKERIFYQTLDFCTQNSAIPVKLKSIDALASYSRAPDRSCNSRHGVHATDHRSVQIKLQT